MSQLFSNCNDPGKGRNMPVHYSGKEKTGVVSPFPVEFSFILVIHHSNRGRLFLM